MRACFIVSLLLASCYAPSTFAADDADTRMRPIIAAKEALVKEEKKLRKTIEESFEERESSARKRGNKELLAQIAEERTDFGKHAAIPKSLDGDRYVRGMRSAYAKVINAYGTLIQSSIKKSDDTFAEEVARDRDSFMASFISENPGLASTVSTAWAHSEGSFEMTSDGMWQEKWGEKKTHAFREVNRSLSSIELFDNSRKCRVILYSGYMDASLGDAPLQRSYSGNWKR